MNPMPPSHERTLAPRQRAFTLLELLVVVAIIGILASLLVPLLGRVQESGRESKCVSNLRQIGAGISLYVGDHNSCLPAASLSKETQNTSGDVMWSKQLGPYIPLQDSTASSKENQVFVCPSARYTGITSATTSRTYNCSAALFYFDSDASEGTAVDPPEQRRVSSLSSAATTILVGEGKLAAGATSGACNSSVSWAMANTDVKKTQPSQTINLDFRHSEKMNVLYADGHVGNVPFSQRATGITQTTWEGRNLTN